METKYTHNQNKHLWFKQIIISFEFRIHSIQRRGDRLDHYGNHGLLASILSI